MGDFVDCLTVSQHSKDPKRKLRLIDELDGASELLDDLAELGSECQYIEGNHGYRLSRFIQDKCPELDGLVKTIPEYLELEERNWGFTPYMDYFKVGKLYMTHDVGYHGKTAIRRSQDDFGANLCIGHVHRLD